MTEDDYRCQDWQGNWFPEHDYGDVECLRCGAEPEDGR